MKIFSNNKVYVQNKDLAYLMRNIDVFSAPSSIFDKNFIAIDENRYKFVEFSKPEEVEFFRKCDWLLDYNCFDGMSEKEIDAYDRQINEESNCLFQQFHNLSAEEKEKEFIKTSSRIKLLEFKMCTVRDILWHHKGYLKFPLPYGVADDYLINNSQQEQMQESKNL